MQKSLSKTANNATNKQLIKLVKNRPAIWDKSDPNYRDKSVKDREWYTICSLLDPEYNSVDKSTMHETKSYTTLMCKSWSQYIRVLCQGCVSKIPPTMILDQHLFRNSLQMMEPCYGALATIKRWYNIRDSYVKNLKLQYSSSKPCKPYLYAKLLTFLDPGYINGLNKTVSKDNDGDKDDNDASNWGSNIFVDANEASGSDINLKTEINDEYLSEAQINDEDEETDWNNSVFVDINEDSCGEPVAKKLKKAVNNEGPQSTDEVISVLAKLIRREEDEDRAFFRSITPSVKKLTEESKFEFRIQVMKLIKILKMRDSAKSKNETKEVESD